MAIRKQSARKKAKTQPHENGSRKSKSAADSFPIVGIGASAGGLDAMERLLKHLPVKTGMAFLLVQHLDPKHESKLTEILSRATSMAVAETKDGMRVEPNHVYIIPPNTSMSLRAGTLRLEPRKSFEAHYLPVDTLFRSLAMVQKNRAIGVILSGTAFDGTAGMKAIKKEGGITFAQDERSAKYFGMPQSSIAAGVVDFVLPPEEIAKRLVKIGRHPYVRVAEPLEAMEPPLSHQRGEPLNQMFRLLQRTFSVDFSAYKFSTISRRIQRRMALRSIGELKDYLQYVRENPEELRGLYQDMFIGVTSFFRDPKVFEGLKKLVFPQILKARSGESSIRIWVPGCSTGEEAYSIAIALLEYLKGKGSSIPIQIFGTDINEEAIGKARAGKYGDDIAPNVGNVRLRRFFSRTESGFEVSKTVRDFCVFAKHDLISTPPFFHLDLVSCRNVLMYMGPDLQQKLLPMFHYTLKPTGFLILGLAETVGGFADLFTSADQKNKIYAKKKGSVALPRFDFVANRLSQPAANQTAPKIPMPRSDLELQREASDRLVLNEHAPPSVLVNEDLEILHFRGHTGLFLEPSPGKASLNLAKMAREGLLVGLQSALRSARKKNTTIRLEGLRVEFDGGEKIVNIQVIPIQPPGSKNRTFLILFENVTEKSLSAAEDAGPGHKRLKEKPSGERLAQLKQELSATKAYLQSVIESQEASNEELRSLNEENLSANEELQSTTEEMEIANEELQSSNEELNTLNEELLHRHSELNRAQSDILNLLNVMNVATLFLDRDFRIRRFTSTARDVLNLKPGDIGRPILDIRLGVEIPNLEDRLRKAMSAIRTTEEMIQGPSGRWYSLQLRPYITADNKIDGAILSLTDVHDLTEKDRELADTRKQFEAIVESAPAGILLVDGNGRIVMANARAVGMFGYPKAELVGQLHDKLIPGPLRDRHLEHTKAYLKEPKVRPMGVGLQLSAVRKDGKEIPVEISLSPIQKDGGVLISTTILDITERKQLEVQIRQAAVLAERNRLARDVHDSLAQGLTGIVLQLEQAEEILTKSPEEANRHIVRARDLARNSLEEARRSLSAMRPVTSQPNLPGAIRQLLNDLQRKAAVGIELSTQGKLLPVPPEVQDNLLRIAQEALHNSIRHGKASQIRVKLRYSKETVRLRIEDNGQGFPPNAKPEQAGMGLSIMRERAGEIGGECTIRSDPGKGTRVDVLAPVAPGSSQKTS